MVLGLFWLGLDPGLSGKEEEARGGREGTWERMDHGNKRASGREKGFPGTQAKGIPNISATALSLPACLSLQAGTCLFENSG